MISKQMSSVMVAGGAHRVHVLFSACAHNASWMRSETKSRDGGKTQSPWNSGWALRGFYGTGLTVSRARQFSKRSLHSSFELQILNVSPYRGDSHGFSALLVADGTIFHV